MRKGGSGAAATAAIVAALVLGTGCGRAPDPCADPPSLSLLALGDTGRIRHPVSPLSEQWAVARALAREDERCPADALLLLGDNFYNKGLEARDLVERLRQNVVGPYCRFVALDGPRSGEVDAACVLPRDRRHVIPLHVVLGNHDYVAPESPELERDAVPAFVPNWRLSRGVLDVVELPEGVSLLLYDPLADGVSTVDVPALTAAVRAARGPWRIVVSHYPIARAGSDPPPDEDLVAEPLRRALGAAGVPVQLALAGHEHALYAAGLGPDGGLQLVAGSGGQVGGPWMRYERALFERRELGFVRIDLVRDDRGERLVASLYATPWRDAVLGRPAELAARFSVTRDGVVSEDAPTRRVADGFGTLRDPPPRRPRGEVPESG